MLDSPCIRLVHRGLGDMNDKRFTTMGNTTINKLIEDFEGLSVDEKEYALDLVKKPLIEVERNALAKRAREAAAQVKKGRVKRGTVKDLYKDLDKVCT